jgi:hypothetical protein
MAAGPEPPRAIDLLLDGLAVRYTNGYVASVPLLRRALQAFAESEEDNLRWLWLTIPLTLEMWTTRRPYNSPTERWRLLATRVRSPTFR